MSTLDKCHKCGTKLEETEDPKTKVCPKCGYLWTEERIYVPVPTVIWADEL